MPTRGSYVVWHYLGDEVRDFARDHPALLTGAAPPQVRAALAAGEDRRPRNWRGRRLGQLLRLSGGRWQRAAASAAVLDPVTIAEVVRDPYERSYLRVLRPELVPARPKSPAGQQIVERLLHADDPDEILWHRTSLADALRQAREEWPAPRPTPRHHPPGRRAVPKARCSAARLSAAPSRARLSAAGACGTPAPSHRSARSLLGRLWRRRAARA